jgi:ATP-dependent helicase/nuclease subunit B
MRLGEEAFAAAGASPANLALWRPRFARAMEWFLVWERARRMRTDRTVAERNGALTLSAPAGDFTLIGRADRIDLFADGSAAILDYKTGQVPSNPQMETFVVPQLPLEGAMLKRGAFAGVRAATVRELIHIRLTGADPPGKDFSAKLDCDAVSDKAFLFLTKLVAAYDNPAKAYISLALMLHTRDRGDYEHLARVGEWIVPEAS